MKLFLVAFAVIAAVAADVANLPVNEYLPPVQQDVQTVALPSNEYLAPINQEPINQGSLDVDGYRYKTNRRVVVRRNRRDVNELPSNEYLPPVQISQPLPSNEYLPPVQNVEPVPAHELADDGYRYKTHRRVVLRRHRRDVNELPSNEYLPPVEVSVPSNEYLAPVSNVVDDSQGQIAVDGYRYKTNRRVVVRRNRRDVNELPSNEYLPPVQISQPLPSNEYLPPVQNVEPVPAHELADDGYRYKTQRRVVLRRHRRDVNELPSNEYLPPVEVSVPSNEYLAPVSNVVDDSQGQIAVDGYRYKTNRRVVVRRNRRDVNELPSNEYLPPVQISQPLPSNEYLPPVQNVEPAPAHELADDGYRYKTHRRVVLRRHRRDVSELSNNYLPPLAAPSNDYLPPVQTAVPQVQISEPSVIDVGVPAVETEVGPDGYRYKTNRRVVYRRRH
ncbi:uncharacterized protein LOC6581332 [Drosophila mojavensis]|uniref:uncharacterized protein LOC6581332 n=1 Tax=Drosophila mojavensis TaxID=7230 RepID=UPI0013EE4A1F|nr:uncharacterized protein LOC6581332 [Drosophila mojavensis]